jgi:hypothetical protein
VGAPHGAGRAWGLAATDGGGQRSGAWRRVEEQRENKVGTGDVVTWRRREGGPAVDGARPATARDRRARAPRSGHVVRSAEQGSGRGLTGGPRP